MQRLLFYCLLILSNFSIAQKEFKMSSDSLEVIARFDGDDSLIVSVTNLSCDSIYIPTKNILKLFSKDTLVNDCDIQVGFDAPNDCETTSIIHKYYQSKLLDAYLLFRETPLVELLTYM
tara:strand:- start:79 stop:435 length:357 start_codon:yes stop_codon:yes gene_type:complete